jgi:cytoskeletal protein CcmA (bactofilin family)
MRGRLGAFLDEGSEIEGSYTCTGTVTLHASVRGQVKAADTLIVGEQAVLQASVQAATLIVYGVIVGNVVASERIEIKANARVTGDIAAPIVVLEEGAVHDGHCRMTQPQAVPHAADPPLALVVNSA